MVLDPEALLVTADLDVVVGENEAAEAVLEGGENGDELVFLLIVEFPDADFAVLVGGEDSTAAVAAAEGDGLHGAGCGGGFVVVEGVEEGVGDGVVDVDLAAGGSIEEVVVEGEEMDVGAAVGGEAVEEGGGGGGKGGGGGGVEGGEGEFLEGRDGGESEEREVGLDAAVAAAGVGLGVGVTAAAGVGE